MFNQDRWVVTVFSRENHGNERFSKLNVTVQICDDSSHDVLCYYSLNKFIGW